LQSSVLFLLLLFFFDRSHFLSGHPQLLSSFVKLSKLLGCQEDTTMPSIFLLRWGPRNFFPLANLDCDPPDPSLQCTWDGQHIPLFPDIDWDGVSWTFCPGWPPTLTLLISAFQVIKLQAWVTSTQIVAFFNVLWMLIK
jgi:hypothetical protein